MLSAEGILAQSPDVILVASWNPKSYQVNLDRIQAMEERPAGFWAALDLDLRKSVSVAAPGQFIVIGPRIIDSYESLVDAIEKKLQNPN